MSPPEKLPSTTESPFKLSDCGMKPENSTASGLKATNGDSALKTPKIREASPLSLMQESLPTPSEMTWSDKLSFYANTTQQQNWLQKLAADSILNGESCSTYWNEFAKAISKHLSSLTPIDSPVSDSLLLSGCANKIKSNSWFSTSVTFLHSKNSLKIFSPSSTVSVQGFTGCESTKSKPSKPFKRKPRNQTTKLTPNSVKKLRVFPCSELHKIWKNWVNAYRWVFNWCVAKCKGGWKGSAYTLQKLARETERPEWVKSLPGHQLQEAVADAVDAHKQALSNGGSGAKFKSCRQPSQVVKFKVGNFRSGVWYPATVKGLEYRSPEGFPTECAYGTQLVWERGKWFGIFPEVRPQVPTVATGVIALDPGVRTFLTGYDGETILEIGSGDIGRIQRLCTHLDKLMSRIDLSAFQRQRRAMRKASHSHRARIQSLVKDLHNKTARFLVDNYKVIFLPTFDTSEMVVKSKRKLKKKTARNMLTWSHFKFKQHLLQMAEREGVLVIECNESYTSKTCPECGHIHSKLGGNKKFQCPECGYTAYRDWNGARNIMVRALQATAFTVIGDAIQVGSCY